MRFLSIWLCLILLFTVLFSHAVASQALPEADICIPVESEPREAEYAPAAEDVLDLAPGDDVNTSVPQPNIAEALLPEASEIPADGTPLDSNRFPSKSFRTWIAENLDADRDGMLSPLEIEQVTAIVLIASDIQEDESVTGWETLKGIETFFNLRELACPDGGLTALDVSGNPALVRLDCSGNALSDLDLSANPALEELKCDNCSLSRLDLTYCRRLISVVCFSNSIVRLKVSGLSSLQLLDCSVNLLKSLDIRGCKSLRKLDCSGNSLITLSVQGCNALSALICRQNRLKGLNLGKNTKLTKLDCSFNRLTSVDVSAQNKLRELSCSYNRLKSLNVRKNRRLSALSCAGNRLTKLDLGRNTKLERLGCGDNRIKTLNLKKNGRLSSLFAANCGARSLDIGKCPSLVDLVSGNAPEHQWGEGITWSRQGEEALAVDSGMRLMAGNRPVFFAPKSWNDDLGGLLGLKVDWANEMMREADPFEPAGDGIWGNSGAMVLVDGEDRIRQVYILDGKCYSILGVRPGTNLKKAMKRLKSKGWQGIADVKEGVGFASSSTSPFCIAVLIRGKRGAIRAIALMDEAAFTAETLYNAIAPVLAA